MKGKILFSLMLALILTCPARGEINKKTVMKAWKNITRAENFPELPVNFESDEDPNAWVAYDDEGNYSVHVTKSLMKILRSESEIAGILGHELGHIRLGHYNNFALSDTVRSIMGANSENADDLARAAGNINLELKESSFSREQETEADNFGVKVLMKAGYSPMGLYNAMKRFDENGLGSDSNGFNSHPASEERLANLARQARENAKEKENEDDENNSDGLDSLADILMGY